MIDSSQELRIRKGTSAEHIAGVPFNTGDIKTPPATSWTVLRSKCYYFPVFFLVAGFIMMPDYSTKKFFDFNASGIIIGSGIISLAWAFLQFCIISRIPLQSEAVYDDESTFQRTEEVTKRLVAVYSAIFDGAESFLRAEYKACSIFVVIFFFVIYFVTSWAADWDWDRGLLTALSFLLGALTSMLSGYIGMEIAVYSNVRTTIAAQRPGYTQCFNVAFRAGSVMGFALSGLGLLMLYFTLLIYKTHYEDPNSWSDLTECITGFGLGGSVIALFGRVGGGIYTKAADVGADLVGKVIHGIPEDDPRNPAVIADNVGDNVGDVAGMGSDLFGSFAESTCAALVLGSSIGVSGGWDAMMFPLTVTAVGILVSIACSFLATNIYPVKTEPQIEKALKNQLISTSFVMTGLIYFVAEAFLPDEVPLTATIGTGIVYLRPWKAWACIASGTLGGLIIGLVTEYYTSHTYKPVRELADACKTGAATNLIYGIALGYKSAIIPVFVLAAVIMGSFSILDLFGVSLAAVGFLSNISTALAIDVYGPVCDNAGGIAEMAELEPFVRQKTDALDAAGNTTAAIGKGFAIGSAAVVSLALIGAFVSRIRELDRTHFQGGVNILEPVAFSFLLIGGMIPYAFAAMTMKSVGFAAMQMVREVQRQFDEKPHLLDDNPSEKPDYDACIEISTKASLSEMFYPGAVIISAPLITGFLFGVTAVSGLLVGSLVSSVQLAISMSNSGGAWDNAKKYIEKQPRNSELGGKGSEIHKAAVVGDTVGDPFKDTSGPSLNIVMKLMAVLSLVFADAFFAVNSGRGVFNLVPKVP